MHKEMKFVLDLKILTFLTLAKVKNFTRAAELLNLTQPAVSQHIKFLEDYYGVTLVKKQGRYITLTEEGKVLLKYAMDLQRLYKDIELQFKNKNTIYKTYNVGASMTIGGYVLPGILAKYKEENPNINIKLHVHNTEEILKLLKDRDLDLAIVEGLFDKSKYSYRKFKDDELVLAASAKSRLLVHKKIKINEILNGELILRERGSGTREILENKLIELGYDLNCLKPYMELGSISAIKSLVENDLGYTIISKETIKKELLAGFIKTMPIEGMKILRDFNFVYLSNYDEGFVDHFIAFALNTAK